MKNMKKIVALLLATVMVMAMSITAFAANGDITVNGPVEGAKYQAVKIFDATMSGDAVSYTLINDAITKVTGFGDIFTTTSAGDKTYVTRKSDSVTDEQIINWIKNNKDAIKAAGVAKGSEVTGAGTSIKLETGELGYYMVWSSKDDTVAVSVDTAHPEATVNSKLPSTPSIDPEEGKKVDGKDVNTMNVGDTVTFTVTFTATNYVVKDGVSTPISQYVVTDTPNGFDIDENTVAVKVNGDDYAIPEKQIGKSKADNGVLTVTIPWDQKTYNTSNTVVVTYNAKLTNKNIANESSNKAKVSYDGNDIPGEPEVYTYNYKVVIDKVDDADTTKKLKDAKFVLKSGDKFYKVDEATGAVTFVSDQKDATVVTTDANGAATFAGLKAGTYTLVETVAPEGYNLASDTTVTLAEVTEKLEETTTLTVTSQVKDKTGAVLPSTGGIGTTMFYIVGSVLVIGAAVVLISKRRMAR